MIGPRLRRSRARPKERSYASFFVKVSLSGRCRLGASEAVMVGNVQIMNWSKPIQSQAMTRRTRPVSRLLFGFMSSVHRMRERRLTTQAQRPGPRDAWIATGAYRPGSLQRMVRRRGHTQISMPCCLSTAGQSSFANSAATSVSRQSCRA